MKQDEINQVEFIMKNIVDFGKFSYNLQEKREESLINQSGKMLTAYPVTMAILTWLIPKTAVVSMYILFFGLTLSLIFAILAGWRFKHRRMPGIDSFFEDVENNMEKYENQYQFNAQWKNQISLLHESKKRNNDKRAIFILMSMTSFICSIIFTIFTAFVFGG